MRKIKVVRNVPVGPEHGLFKDRVMDVVEKKDTRQIWVVGDTGEEVKLHPHEYEMVSA